MTASFLQDASNCGVAKQSDANGVPDKGAYGSACSIRTVWGPDYYDVMSARPDRCLVTRASSGSVACDPQCRAGIISCLAYSPMADGLLAAGAYSGTAALYDTRTLGATCILSGHSGGITQA